MAEAPWRPPDGWPALPADETDFKKIVYQALVDLHKAEVPRAEDRLRASFDADDKVEGALFQGYHEAIRELAKSNAGRLESSAETVQKAAAALTGLYTALLGFVYVVGEVGLPPRALLPALFLGLAVLLSTAYVSFIRKPDDVDLRVPSGVPRAKALAQTANFILWSRQRYLRRASWIRASVLSLAFALILLPAPLLSAATEAPAAPPVPGAPPWPAAPAGDVNDAQVALFEAQVGEVAALRQVKSSPAPPPLPWYYEALIWLVGLVGVGAVVREFRKTE